MSKNRKSGALLNEGTMKRLDGREADGVADEEELVASIERIDAATSGFVDAFEAKRALSISEGDGSYLQAVDLALTYVAQDQVGSKRFTPWAKTEFSEFPPPPKEMSEDVLRTWEQLSHTVTSPVIRARLHELCFVANSGHRREHAARAIEAYIEMARKPLPERTDESKWLRAALDSVDNVGQAVRLATFVRLHELSAEAVDLVVDLARAALVEPDLGPGVLFGLLKCVTGLNTCPSEVDEFLESARRLYADDVWNTASVIELQLERARLLGRDPIALRRDQVQSLLDAANTSAPLVALLHLQDAAALAEPPELSDLRGVAIVRMQALCKEDIGLTAHRFEFSWPSDVVDAWIASLLDADSWQIALLRLLNTGPPMGRVEDNRARASESASSVTSVFPSTILDRGKRPVQTLAGDDPTLLLLRAEKDRYSILVPLLGLGLSKILERWGPLDEAEGTSFFAEYPHVPTSTAAAVVRAFNRFHARDIEGSSFTGVPRIERVIREYLTWRNEPVWTPPSGSDMSTYPGLGALLGRLGRLGVDPSWVRFLSTFLSNPIGMNYRNDSLHGHVDDPTEIETATVLIALAYVCIGLPLPPTVIATMEPLV